MNNNDNPLRTSDEKIIAGLEKNLQKQLELMRNSRIDAAMEITEKTSESTKYISKKKLLQDEKYSIQRQNIQKLFKEITLAAAARKEALFRELSKLRRGRKSLSAYKNQSESKYSNLL